MQTFREIIAGHQAADAEMPWLTLVSGDQAEPYTIGQIVARTCDYCAFYVLPNAEGGYVQRRRAVPRARMLETPHGQRRGERDRPLLRTAR